MSTRDDLRQLFVLNPAPGRWTVALQAAIAMAIPLFGFALAGRQDLGLLASIGAFTALHFASRSRRQRMTLLPLIALALVAASAIGAAAAASALSAAVAVWAVALVAALLSLGFSVGSPGAMFVVLVAGVSTHLVANGVDGRLLVGMVAVGSAIAYLVVLAPLLIPRIRRTESASAPVRFRFDSISRIVFTRLAIGATLAAVLATVLGIHRGYWVIVAVVVILQNGHQLRLTAIRALHRVAGTVLGVGLFAIVALWHPSGLLLALLLTVLQFIVEMFIVRNYGLAIVFITPLALTISAQGAQTGEVVVERIVDTAIGAGIALAVLVASWLLRRR